jgi:hypothetical protein
MANAMHTNMFLFDWLKKISGTTDYLQIITPFNLTIKNYERYNA